MVVHDMAGNPNVLAMFLWVWCSCCYFMWAIEYHQDFLPAPCVIIFFFSFECLLLFLCWVNAELVFFKTLFFSLLLLLLLLFAVLCECREWWWRWYRCVFSLCCCCCLFICFSFSVLVSLFFLVLLDRCVFF